MYLITDCDKRFQDLHVWPVHTNHGTCSSSDVQMKNLISEQMLSIYLLTTRKILIKEAHASA